MLDLLSSRVRSVTSDDAYDPWDEDINWDALTPEGWRFLGNGAQRVCWLGPDGWVYKFQLEPRSDFNYAEYERCKSGFSHPHVYVPEVQMVGDVLLMEYVEGEWPPSCYYSWCRCDKGFGGECWAELLTKMGLRDVHEHNAMMIGDMIVPIDLAM